MSRLKRIFTSGERATYRIVEEVAGHHEVKARRRYASLDVIDIDNSGITNEEYSYALKAHFDVVLVEHNLPLMAVEFDGGGHDAKKDHLKNSLCDRFGLPMVRVGMIHLNSKTFEDTAAHFLIYQLFGVDHFLETHGHDPNEPYDPAFFAWVAGKDTPSPFYYAARWRSRLVRPFKRNLHLFGDRARDLYEPGLIQFAAIDGAWARGDRTRAICGQYINSQEVILGTAELTFRAFGLEGRRRELFLRLQTFVIGLAGGEMYENAMTFRRVAARGCSR
jgi:hypothetical protein